MEAVEDKYTKPEDTKMTENKNIWIEQKVAEMLKALRRSGFFDQGINDARHFQSQYGYTWDVALKMSCNYWCS